MLYVVILKLPDFLSHSSHMTFFLMPKCRGVPIVSFFEIITSLIMASLLLSCAGNGSFVDNWPCFAFFSYWAILTSTSAITPIHVSVIICGLVFLGKDSSVMAFDDPIKVRHTAFMTLKLFLLKYSLIFYPLGKCLSMSAKNFLLIFVSKFVL